MRIPREGGERDMEDNDKMKKKTVKGRKGGKSQMKSQGQGNMMDNRQPATPEEKKNLDSDVITGEMTEISED